MQVTDPTNSPSVPGPYGDNYNSLGGSSYSIPTSLMPSYQITSDRGDANGHNGLVFMGQDFFSLNPANECVTTPLLGQKNRMQRRGQSTASNSFNQQLQADSNSPSPSSSSHFPMNEAAGLIPTGFVSEARTILSDSLLLPNNPNSSMGTMNKNMTLNSNSNNQASSPTSATLPASACKVNVPKAPKPQRTLALLDCVIVGLNLSLNDLRTKVADLTSAVTNGYNAMAKQLLQSESYLRHLEQRISTLLKLQQSYTVHLKMKDGIQNMYEAYKKSPGNQQKNLANIKVGWKDCIQKLCAIEAQTEALLGTFQFEIEKLIGFARLCPGDTYELLIKYGTGAKFRTRTKIGKDGSQTWDCSKFSFKITVQDLLLIRINEIKFLGKNLLIGERVCDTRDLFSTTQTQRLTLNANISGTLKLSMLITWLPFENCEESFIYYNPTQYLTMGSKEKRLSSYTMTKLANHNQYQQHANTLPMSPTQQHQQQLEGTTSPNQHQQYRPISLQVDTTSNFNSIRQVLTAITDTDDNDFDPSAASSSSSTASSSSKSSGKNKKTSNEPTESATTEGDDETKSKQTTSTMSSNSSIKLTESSKTNDSATNSSINLDNHNELSFCSSSQSNLSNVVSHANTSHTSHEDFRVFSDVEKCLDSILNNLDIEQSSKSKDQSKAYLQINLIKLVKDLFTKLQKRIDHLRAGYIELNDLHELAQSYEVLIEKLTKKDDSGGKLLHAGSVKKQVVRSENVPVTRSSESSQDDEDISIVLDDVMQYFDFLDDAENNSDVDGDKVSVKLVKGINVDGLPSDFNHFLIRHFSHCIQLLDDLKFINKSQMNTHFKLFHLEAIIFEKIGTEANILKSFLKALTATITTTESIQTFNPLIIEILSKSLTNSTSLDAWLKAISIEENSKDKCILNADKSNLVANIMKQSLVDSSKPLALNSLINRIVATSSSNEDDQQHASISVYHFTAIQNLVDANATEIGILNNQLECLQEDPTKWMSELDPAFIEVSLKEKRLFEVILVSLVHKIALEGCQETREVLAKFIDSASGMHITGTVGVVLSLVLETLLGFNLKSTPTDVDIAVLKLLKEILRSLSNKKEDLVDSTVVEFIELQIDNQTSV